MQLGAVGELLSPSLNHFVDLPHFFLILRSHCEGRGTAMVLLQEVLSVMVAEENVPHGLHSMFLTLIESNLRLSRLLDL